MPADPDIALPGPTGEVAKALDDYCEARGLSWENIPGRYGLGVGQEHIVGSDRLTHEPAGIPEQPRPTAVLADILRMPRILHVAG